MKSMKFAFTDWFKEQHGARTASGMASVRDEELRKAIALGREANRILTARQLWDEKHQSALYAWNVKQKVKV